VEGATSIMMPADSCAVVIRSQQDLMALPEGALMVAMPAEDYGPAPPYPGPPHKDDDRPPPPPYTPASRDELPPHHEEMVPPSYEEVERLKAAEAGTEEAGVEAEALAEEVEADLLGTDAMFMMAFAAAFLLNWVGFVVLVCFCRSVAGRCGALAGFGLSLAKWAVIMRGGARGGNTALLWLILLLGLVIFSRAVLQYQHAKKVWREASNAARQRFLVFH